MFNNKAKMSDIGKNEKLCRLCGEMELNSHQILAGNSSEKDELVETILGYLGIQLVENGIKPNYLCHSCYFAAGSTDLYLKRVLSGQEKLKHMEQTKLVKTARQEPLLNVVHSQEPSTDEINWGRMKKEATSKKPTKNAEVPVGNSTENDLLSSYNYLGDKSDIPCLQSFQNKQKIQTSHQGVRIISNSSGNFNITEGIINSMDSLNGSAEINEMESGIIENVQDHGTMTNSTTSNLDVRNSQSKTNGIGYHCKKCEKEFSTQSSAQRHLKYVHAGEPQFKCTECTATFKYRTNYSYHMAKYTGEWRFKCDICAKAFRLKTELVTHLRTHTGNKPFKCEYCNKGFAAQSNMVTHTRLHTGLKPFKCEKCDRQFNRSSQLKAHKAVHLKQEKFSLSMLKFNSSEGQVEILPPIRNSIGQVTAQNVTQNGISQLLESTAEGEFPFVSMLDSNNLQSLSEKNSDCSLPYLDPKLNEILNIGIKDVEYLQKSKGVNITYSDPENPNVSTFFVTK